MRLSSDTSALLSTVLVLPSQAWPFLILKVTPTISSTCCESTSSGLSMSLNLQLCNSLSKWSSTASKRRKTTSSSTSEVSHPPTACMEWYTTVLPKELSSAWPYPSLEILENSALESSACCLVSSTLPWATPSLTGTTCFFLSKFDTFLFLLNLLTKISPFFLLPHRLYNLTAKTTALGRHGETSELSDAVKGLMESSFMTGTFFHMDSSFASPLLWRKYLV